MDSQFVCDEPEGCGVEVDCVVCGTRFQYRKNGRGRLRRTCSDACHAIRKARRIASSPCANCGLMFNPKYTNLPGHGRYCSQTCYHASTKIYASKRHAKSEEHRRRRARKRGAETERFASLEIYQRDNWMCGLCHRKVDRRLKAPDKMAASLDHIVPLAEGGAHTRQNSQCSHWLCNSRKTSGAGGQLRLLP